MIKSAGVVAKHVQHKFLGGAVHRSGGTVMLAVWAIVFGQARFKFAPAWLLR